MKYVYVVTAIPIENSHGVLTIPNLGVHSNLEKAESHFNSVVKDRSKVYSLDPWITSSDSKIYGDERYKSIAEANFHAEIVRLEKWVIR